MELRHHVPPMAALLLLCLPPSTPTSYCADSSKDFKIWGDNCYYTERADARFDDAQKTCESWNSQLASIHSAEEAEFINDLYVKDGHYKDYWIGMKKINRSDPVLENNYKWVDGTPKDFKLWAPNEPDDQWDDEDCVMAFDSGDLAQKWRAFGCHARNGYVCKAPLVRGWQEDAGYQYYISSMPEEIDRTWYEARDWCMQHGADLASVLTQDEATKVAEWTGKNEYKGQLWIGLNKLDRKNWRFSDEKDISYDNWKEGYPKQGKYGYLCAYQQSSDKTGKWVNGHCDSHKGFICKREKTDNPTPKTSTPTQPVDGFCPAGYTGLGNKCLKVVLPGQWGEGALSFNDALVQCRQGPGRLPTLASIHSELEQAFLDAHLTTYGLGVWIGLRRELFGADWTWVDSSPFEYSHWRSGAPEEHTSHHCTEAWTELFNHGQWNNVMCSDKRGYVCQTFKDENSPIKTSPAPSANFTCPENFTPYFYGCYKYETTELTYNLALEKCKNASKSAELVGIHFEAENAAIHTIAGRDQVDLWTGFRDNMNGGEYQWGDGWAVLYTNWASGQPKKDEGGGCVKMSPDGTWSDTICSLQKRSVCKISQVPPLTAPPPLGGRCPLGTGWYDQGAVCYLFLPREYLNWKAAREYCQKQDIFSDLASIHSYTENKMIHDKLVQLDSKEDSVWIGLSRSEKDISSLRWSDGSSLQFEAWAPHEPNGEESNENCVEMWNEEWPQKWNDVPCSSLKGFVCKALKRPHASLPTLSPHCEGGWTWDVLSGKCYLMKPSEQVPYQKAQRICEESGAQLASIHDFIQNYFIETEMRNAQTMPYAGFWIGMTATKNEATVYEFGWVDGSEVKFENWNNSPTEIADRRCVEMRKDGSWINHDCSEVHGYVCMKTKKTPTEQPGPPLSGGQVAGIVIGVLLGVALLVLIVVSLLVHQQVIDNPAARFTGGSRPQTSPGLGGVDSSVSYNVGNDQEI